MHCFPGVWHVGTGEPQIRANTGEVQPEKCLHLLAPFLQIRLQSLRMKRKQTAESMMPQKNRTSETQGVDAIHKKMGNAIMEN
jgi:hypothetical protein